MRWGLLKKILEEATEHRLTNILAFHLMGEPLLHPDFFRAASLSHSLGLRLHLTTNGSTLALYPEHAEKLTNSRISKVTISLQTPDAKSFALRGAPDRLSSKLYFQGIMRYIRMNLQNQNSTTPIHLKFLDTAPHLFLSPYKPLTINRDAGDMQNILENWCLSLYQNIGDLFDISQAQKKIKGYRPGRWQVFELHPRLSLETFPLDCWADKDSQKVYQASFGYCSGASAQAGILADGTVVPCCKDHEGAIPLGNVAERSLNSVLQDIPAKRLKKDFSRFRIREPLCRDCIGDASLKKALLRQFGSIAYFKLYRPLMRRIYPGWGDI